MRAVDLIVKKREGGSLTTEEIDFLIEGFTRGEVADEQMAAWAMAVFFRGMDERETADLTMAMARSGEQLDLHDIAPLTVDKHSTGGVGDKTTLVLAPLLASLGLPVAKMSGRGLGFSGGTLDKIESIPGLRVDLSADEFRQALRQRGLVLAGQSADLAPADKRLYALRDVTGSVESLPLVAASVMSKKLAAGADCIVLDVKAGRGAFAKSHADARELARRMVGIGRRAGRRVAAIISSMDQPLGQAVGNALELKEAIESLRGGGPADLRELCMALGAQLLLLAGTAGDEQTARALLERALDEGAAWQKLRALVAGQGGELAVLDDPSLLPAAPVVQPLPAQRGGHIAAIDALALGLTAGQLGGGRQRKDDAIDHAVGLVLRARVGDQVAAGQPLLEIHARDAQGAQQAAENLAGAITIVDQPVARPALILEVVTD